MDMFMLMSTSMHAPVHSCQCSCHGRALLTYSCDVTRALLVSQLVLAFQDSSCRAARK